MASIEATHDSLAQVQNGRAAIEMVAASLCFATMSCIAHGFSGQVAWPIVAFARILVTAALVLVALALYRAPLVIRGTRALWARSITGAIGLICTFYAITHMPVTDTVTVFATGPVWVTVILAFMFKRAVRKRVWFHVLLALLGVYVMHRPTFDAASLPLFVALFGAIAAAAAKVSISFCHGLRPLSIVAHYACCATLITGCLALTTAGATAAGPGAPPWLWLWLVPMGLAGTLAQLLMTTAYRRGGTTMVALVGISQIAFAALYDLAIWGHSFDRWKIAGVLMIACAIAMNITATARDFEDATKD